MSALGDRIRWEAAIATRPAQYARLEAIAAEVDALVPAERDDLAEQGRRLASEREDLIAQGVDPSLLLIPLHPESDDLGTTNG